MPNTKLTEEQQKQIAEELRKKIDRDASDALVYGISGASRAATKALDSYTFGTKEFEAKTDKLARRIEEFKQKYPDIWSDKKRFEMADALTITIQNEHPGWTPEQVCDEAGRRTREIYAPDDGKDAYGCTVEQQRAISMKCDSICRNCSA